MTTAPLRCAVVQLRSRVGVRTRSITTARCAFSNFVSLDIVSQLTARELKRHRRKSESFRDEQLASASVLSGEGAPVAVRPRNAAGSSSSSAFSGLARADLAYDRVGIT